MKPEQRNGWIYFIENNGFVKVGITQGTVEQRLNNYRTHNPHTISLLLKVFVAHPADGEQQAHALLFKATEKNGTDWVKAEPSTVEAVTLFLQNFEKEFPPITKKVDNVHRDSFATSKVPFTQVANSVLNDPTLTARAKGIYAYLYSKPESWDFNYLRITKDHKESKNTILAALQELEAAGYLERRKLPTGRTDYYLSFEPKPKDRAQAPKKPKTNIGAQAEKKPKTKVGRDQTLERPNFGHISNTDTEVINNISNTPPAAEATEKPAVTAESPEEVQIGEIIFLFQEVNPSYKTLYNRKPQRESARRLLNQHGFQRTKAMIAFLMTSNASRYAPTITTPCQLEEKLGELKAWADKQRTHPKGKGIISSVENI